MKIIFKKIILTICIFSLLCANAHFVFSQSLYEQKDFYINENFDLNSRNKLTSSLRIATPKFYVYIDDSVLNNLSFQDQTDFVNKVFSFVDSFEKNDYSRLINLFGKEPKNVYNSQDEHITILIHPMKNDLGGYIDERDLYSKNTYFTSNERVIIYLDSHKINNSPDFVKYFLAHEFMHLITHNAKNIKYEVSEDIWLNEMRAEYIGSFLGYDALVKNPLIFKRLNDFIKNPNVSLTDIRELEASIYNYAALNIFSQYIAEKYSPVIFIDSLKTNLVGLDSLDYALKTNQYKDSFDDIFKNWLITVVINDCNFDEKYCYKNNFLKNLKIFPLGYYIPTYGNSSLLIDNKTKPYTPNWLKIVGGKNSLNIDFQFDKQAKAQLLYLLIDSQGHYHINESIFDKNNKAKIFVNNFNKDYIGIILIPYVLNKDNFQKEYQYSFQVVSDDSSQNIEKAKPISQNQVQYSQPPYQNQQAIKQQIIQLQLKVIELLKQLILLLKARANTF